MHVGDEMTPGLDRRGRAEDIDTSLPGGGSTVEWGVGYWWSGDPDERLIMEITGRRDIGTDLHCPAAGRGGVSTPGYFLINDVLTGDVVVHYDSRAAAIVGISRAAGAAVPEPVWWAARGSYARRAAVKPEWLPGLAVPLTGYRLPAAAGAGDDGRPAGSRRADHRSPRRSPRGISGIPTALSLDSLPEQCPRLSGVFGQAPRAILPMLPEIADALIELPSTVEQNTSDPSGELDMVIAVAAGRPRPGVGQAQAGRGGGQGFAVDQALKVAVEAHAMNAARDHYERLGTVKRYTTPAGAASSQPPVTSQPQWRPHPARR